MTIKWERVGPEINARYVAKCKRCGRRISLGVPVQKMWKPGLKMQTVGKQGPGTYWHIGCVSRYEGG